MNNIKKITLNKKLSNIDEDYTNVVYEHTIENYPNGITNIINTNLYYNNNKLIGKIEKINNLVEFIYNKDNVVTKINLLGNLVLKVLKESENKFKNHPFTNAETYYIYKSEYHHDLELKHGIFFDDRYNILGRFEKNILKTDDKSNIHIKYMNINGEKIGDYQETILTFDNLIIGWNLVGQISYDNAKIDGTKLENLYYFDLENGYIQIRKEIDDYYFLPKGKGIWIKKMS